MSLKNSIKANGDMKYRIRGAFICAILTLLLLSWCIGIDHISVHLFKFWLYDKHLQPLPGFSRFFIYWILQRLMLNAHLVRPPLGDSPLQAPEIWDKTVPEFRKLETLLHYLLPNKFRSTRFLKGLRLVTIIGYGLSAIGFGGQLPCVISGIGTFLLQGFTQPYIAISHRWYVPLYTVLALMFTNGRHWDSWSVDHFLCDTVGHDYPFRQPETGSILRTNLGLKLVLVFSISTLFLGGVTKLLNSGFKWMNGRTLQYHLSQHNVGKLISLKLFLVKHLELVSLMSIASVVLELSSILVIWSNDFSYNIRPIILASGVCFHIGIWLLMHPNYFPQMCCYVLLINWNFPDAALQEVENLHLCAVWVWIPTLLCLFLVYSTLYRIEKWPISGIPMYSLYRDLAELPSIELLKRHTFPAIEYGYPISLVWKPGCTHLVLVNSKTKGQEEFRRVFNANLDFYSDVYVNLKFHAQKLQRYRYGLIPKYWASTIGTVAAMHLVSSEMKSNYSAKQWLENNVPVFKKLNWDLPSWTEIGTEIWLICELPENIILLSKAHWS